MSSFIIYRNRTNLFNLVVDTSLSSLADYSAKLLISKNNDLVLSKDLSINGFVLSGNLTYNDSSIAAGNVLGEIIIDNSINRFNVRTDLGDIFNIEIKETNPLQ